MKHGPRPGGRFLGVLAAPLVLAGVLAPAGPAAASASGCQTWASTQPPGPGTSNNEFLGAAVLSSCDAWAVGFDLSAGLDQALVEHWNGSSWTVVPSPSPGSSASLTSVRALSANDIWAAGSFSESAAEHTLIEHWNGSSWSVVPSPSPGSAANELNAVRGVSASDVWAVGDTSDGTGNRPLILHWNGRCGSRQ